MCIRAPADGKRYRGPARELLVGTAEHHDLGRLGVHGERLPRMGDTHLAAALARHTLDATAHPLHIGRTRKAHIECEHKTPCLGAYSSADTREAAEQLVSDIDSQPEPSHAPRARLQKPRNSRSAALQIPHAAR